MAALDSASDRSVPAPRPAVRRIGWGDLTGALAQGVDDFRAKPSHVIFLCVIYPVVGLLLAKVALGHDVLPLVFPLLAGFALVGPFAALGLYELSRRREQGLDMSWRHAFEVRHSASLGAILALGAALMGIFIAWIVAAQAIYTAEFGDAPVASMPDFAQALVSTAAGWRLIVIGNGVGLLFAAAVLAISVVSFPMMIDRKVSATTAVATSLRAVAANPATLALWGLIVAGLLALGSLALFIGLAVVIPVLGHATWHLYRRIVPR